MKYCFLISKLNLKLSQIELESLLEIFNVKYSKKNVKNLSVIETSSRSIEKICERSALIKLCSKVISETPCNLNSLEKKLSEIHWNKQVTCPFKLRIIDLTRSYKHKVPSLEKRLSKHIWNSINNPSVNLKNPKTAIYIILTSKKFYITRLVWTAKPNRFEKREPKKKPEFHPTILRPWLARVLVNLSRAKSSLLDPFCGTGSILIESSLMGIKAKGSDLDTRMLKRTNKNLEHFKLDVKLKRADATQLSKYFKKVKAIATDPPYKRSSFSSKEDTSELYAEFLEEVSKILEKNKYISFMIPKKVKLKIPDNLKIINKAELYVHGSLTRKIVVLIKK